MVASGILLSRIAGLVRDRVFAHYLGNTAPADAFRAALRIPNVLQNLFGEGVLSASFIPVYAGMLSRDENRQAKLLAGAVGGFLCLGMSLMVLLGLLLAPVLTDLLAPGFTGQKRLLTISLVRILFPSTAILVMSAWCLGILNSHRRFFVSYAAPVLWNGAIIVALVYFGPTRDLPDLAIIGAWAAVAGSILQIAVQIPQVIRLSGTSLPSLRIEVPGLRQVIANAIPVTISRGVVQISGYVDSIIASLLPTGAVAALGYAQTLYLLPASLFGMSVSAAELPELSSSTGTCQQIADQISTRLQKGLRRILFMVAPSVVGFIALGQVIVGAIYRSGRFGPADTRYVWAILATASIGLPASTLSRLYCAAFYARSDTRTPLMFSIIRVVLSTIIGAGMAFYGPRLIGIEARWGVVGLVMGSAIGGIVEYLLLRRATRIIYGSTTVPIVFIGIVWGSAAIAALVASIFRMATIDLHPIAEAMIVLPVYWVFYLAIATALGLHESRDLIARLARLAQR